VSGIALQLAIFLGIGFATGWTIMPGSRVVELDLLAMQNVSSGAEELAVAARRASGRSGSTARLSRCA
jgi:hypothetical protein